MDERRSVVGFLVRVNDGQPVVAGLPRRGVVTVTITRVQRPERTSIELRVGGLDSDERTHVEWLERPLEVGDRIELSVVEAEPTPPVRLRSEYTDVELRRDQDEGVDYWLRFYKREREAIDRQIAVAERALAERDKQKP